MAVTEAERIRSLFEAWCERQFADESMKWPKKTRLFADGAVDALEDILAGRMT